MTSRGDALPNCGCGGGPALVWTTKKRTPRTYQRICSICVISTNHCDSEAEANAAWTRAMSSAQPAEVTQADIAGLIASQPDTVGYSIRADWAAKKLLRHFHITRRPAPQAEGGE